MPPEFMDILKAQGLAGLIILALGFAVIKLYNRTQELSESLNELGREAVKANEQLTSALNQMAEVNRATGNTIQQMMGMVQQLLWSRGHKPQGD